MIRLFAPSTPDRVLHGDLVTAVSLALHGALLLVILGPQAPPPGQPSALDRLVVFLVPPDRTPSPGEEPTGMTWGTVAAAERQGGGTAAEVEGGTEQIAARGEVPLLDSEALNAVPQSMEAEDAYTVLEVDSMVVRDPTSAAPEYPEHLRTQGIEGSAFVRYVVDTLGRVDTLTYRVVRTTHPDFAVAVRRALPYMRFRPALHGSRRVRQLVEQNFNFKLVRRGTSE